MEHQKSMDKCHFSWEGRLYLQWSRNSREDIAGRVGGGGVGLSKGKGKEKCLRELESHLAWLEQDRLVDAVGKMSWNQMVKGVKCQAQESGPESQ